LLCDVRSGQVGQFGHVGQFDLLKGSAASEVNIHSLKPRMAHHLCLQGESIRIGCPEHIPQNGHNRVVNALQLFPRLLVNQVKSLGVIAERVLSIGCEKGKCPIRRRWTIASFRLITALIRIAFFACRPTRRRRRLLGANGNRDYSQAEKHQRDKLLIHFLLLSYSSRCTEALIWSISFFKSGLVLRFEVKVISKSWPLHEVLRIRVSTG